MKEILGLKTPQHVREWLALLATQNQLVVEAARDHGKSFVFSYAWPLFNIQRCHPGSEPIHVALVSYAEEQAKKNLARIRKAIEGNEELHWLLPKSKAYVWDSGALNLSNECTIETFGFGSSVRGGHYHKIIIDDPTKDHWTISVEEQENFLYGVLLPALRRGGQLVICGNPIGKKDLLERLENNPEFSLYKYPALNEKGEALWPEQYPVEAIEARKRMIPAHIFAREYMLKRVSAADAKFKEEWFRFYDPQSISGKILYRVLTIDPAFSPGGDALAAVYTGTDMDANTYILDRFSYRGDFKSGLGQLCDFIGLCSLPDFIGFETFAFQKMYKVLLEEELKNRGIPAFIQETGKDSKRTKAMRIESLQPKIASGKLLFLREHKDVIDQFLLWDPISRTNDDDLIDALSWQVALWRRPFDDSPIEEVVKAGTFAAAAEEIMKARDLSYMGKMFEDLGNA